MKRDLLLLHSSSSSSSFSSLFPASRCLLSLPSIAVSCRRLSAGLIEHCHKHICPTSCAIGLEVSRLQLSRLRLQDDLHQVAITYARCSALKSSNRKCRVNTDIKNLGRKYESGRICGTARPFLGGYEDKGSLVDDARRPSKRHDEDARPRVMERCVCPWVRV